MGVVGGTFDPPHLGHLVLGAAAKAALGLERVLFAPAGEQWRKAGRPVSPADVRLELVRAAVEELEWAEVSTVDIERPGPTYTVDTLSALLERRGGQWWFLVGEDALADLPNWHQADRVLELARLGVACRPPAEAHIPPEVRARFPAIDERIDIVPMPPLDVSSSDLRRRVRDGLPTDHLLPERVRALIDEGGLYTGANARED